MTGKKNNMKTLPTMEELYKAMPNLKAHHESQIAAVKRMQEKPVDWEKIRRQIDRDFATHGQINPNKHLLKEKQDDTSSSDK